MTDMKQVYQLVDNSIKEGLSESKLKSIIELTPAEEQLGPLFDIPVTSEYILRRFINACMSTDQQIRQHASQGLQNWVERCAISPNLDKLIKYIIDVSNYKKGSNRKSQSDAFATGRVLVVRSLSSFLKNNSQVFQSLNQVLSEFRQIEQQVIEACHLISQDKILKLKFHSLSPRSQSSRFLFKLLLKTKDPKSESVKIQDFDGILETETQNYPKTSTVLYNFGRYLHTVTDNPMQFFRKYANKFLDNDSDKQVDIHEIFSILTVLKGFLKYNQITFENSKFYFDKKIISVWLEQFRVLNKKMKSTAKAISIKFENNPELAYQILVDLHEQGVYLDNISNNHPLSQLYQAVDAEKYFTYIYQLCLNSENDIEEENGQKATKSQQKPQKTAKKAEKQKEKMNETDQNKQQEQQENQETFYNELEYLIKLRFKDLPDSAICSSIILLLNRYHKNQKRKQLLYLCINLLNLICKTVKEKKSKGRKLNKKMMLIMNELNLTQLLNLDEEKVNNFKKAMLWIKKNTVKIRKQENYDPSQAEIDFFNFYNCLVFFSLIYPEEIETCVELQLLYKDLLAFYNNKNEQLEGKPQKRVKRQKGQNDGEEAKKPIHVLTDIFISLMTKPPVFLRKSIHNLFKSIVQFLDTTDIGNMLTVITTPDAEFIQEI